MRCGATVGKQSRITPTLKRASLLMMATAGVFAGSSARATTFVWTKNASGNASGSWAVAANWNNGAGPVASGSDNTADFSTIDLTTTSTVTLDGNQNIGNLIFGDPTPTNLFTWVLSPGSPTTSTLTLDAPAAGSPGITVNALGTVTFNVPIDGTMGFTKYGGGQLTLSPSTVNTYTGDTAVRNGTLQLTFANLATPTDLINNQSNLFLDGGKLIVVGKSGAATSQTFAPGSFFVPGFRLSNGNAITMTPNGATSTTLTLSNTWTRDAGATLVVDLSAGTTSNPVALVSTAGQSANSSQTSSTPVIPFTAVKDATGMGFGYVNASSNIVRYTGAVPLTVSGLTASSTPSGSKDVSLNPTMNYSITLDANLTISTASTSLTANSLQLQPSDNTTARTLNLNGKTFGSMQNDASGTLGGIVVNNNAQITVATGQLGLTGNELIIHKSGTANLQLNADVTLAGGSGSGSAGSVTVDGDGSTGLIVIANNTSTYSGGFRLNSGATVVPQASSISNGSGGATSGPFGSGTFTFGGGLIRATSAAPPSPATAYTVDNPVSFAADVNIVSGGSQLAFTGAGTLTGGTRAINNPAGPAVSFNGPIGEATSGSGIIKLGAGIVVLGGANTYTGPTTVSAGTLILNGSVQSAVNVGSTATLAGAGGSIAGPVTVSGSSSKIAPGPLTSAGNASAGPGQLNITGNLTLASTATYAVELSGTTPGNAVFNYDQIKVTGGATVTGSTLTVTTINGFQPQPGNIFYILAQGGTAAPGTFLNRAEGSTFTLGTQTAKITYLANYNFTTDTGTLTGGNDIAISITPEPASIALLGLGGLGLLGRRRRSRNG